ncbi:unnamed protein product [Blepharisma stoltei]|uniref:chitin synthase n=1 Tax=Blepharisma stoltei TaxID=1481888 RepID=A0AAU9JDN3_9CILI|nr:unnamed protein product [Blepharisma stoltei]
MDAQNGYWCDYQPFFLNKHMGRRRKRNGEAQMWGLDDVNGFKLVGQSIDELGLLQKYKRKSRESIGCEVVIGIFIQPDEESHFAATMDSVVKNVKNFKDKGLSVLCIAIADGREKLKSADNDSLMGSVFHNVYYDESLIEKQFNLSKENNKIPLKYFMTNPAESQTDEELAHMFMHRNWLKIDEGGNERKIDLIFCIKEKYSGKLNSHLWFFGGFCQHINPRIVMLLDAGVKPQKNALIYMWKALRADENLAGCTGELKPDTKKWKDIFRYAQVAEYKSIYMLDKALESVVGYISSLPSCFSAYQWKALSMPILLETHFKSICNPEEIDAANSNYYLSVDRLLSLSLFMQRKQKYTLRFVKRSKAKIHVSNKVYKIMLTRRKWINGTWFILLESLKKSYLIFGCKTNHPWYRIILFALQMILFITNFFFSWLIVGYFFVFLAQGLRTRVDNDHVQDIFMIFYGLLLEHVLILSLGVSPKKADKCLTYMSYILLGISIVSVYFFLGYWFQQPDGGYSMVYFAAFLTASGLFILNLLFYLEIIFSIPFYVILIPVLVNICMVYSICNIHDCSNSHPEKITEKEREQIARFQSFRAFWLLVWISTNGVFAYGLYELIEEKKMYALIAIAMVGMANIIIRLIGGLVYHAKEWVLNKHDDKIDQKNHRIEDNVEDAEKIFIEVPSLSDY